MLYHTVIYVINYFLFFFLFFFFQLINYAKYMWEESHDPLSDMT